MGSGRSRIAFLLLAAGLLALAAGLFLGGHPGLLPGFVRDAFVDEQVALQADVRDTIEDNYYKKVPARKLDDASLGGMVRSLHDRFSHYLTPEDYRVFSEQTSGSYSGVGTTVTQARLGLRVAGVIDGAPADRAGIRPGDLIVSVDGRSIAGESSDVATARIKGKAGTSVTLGVIQPPRRKPKRVRLKRAKVTVPVVAGKIKRYRGTRYAVVRLATFSSGAHGELRRKIDQLLGRGAKGIVLDLRANGGGLLNEGVLVASIFIKKGVIVTTRGRKSPERAFDATGGAISPSVPVVVLVDRGTASASEIVTGALQDYGRAGVVGARTFGKGVFQEVYELSNGGALDITVGNYFTPKGRNLAGRGIAPDVRAKDIPRTPRDEALPVALRTLASER